jgi:hypothetical protein
MKSLSLWKPKAIVRHDDEIIEGEIVEEKNNRGITRSGGRANFRAEIVEATKNFDARIGQVDPYLDYHQDPFLLRMDKEKAEYEAKQKEAERKRKELEAKQEEAQPPKVRSRFFSKLPKPYQATVLLPSGEKVVVNSKEEETAIIRKHWR